MVFVLRERMASSSWASAAKSLIHLGTKSSSEAEFTISVEVSNGMRGIEIREKLS